MLEDRTSSFSLAAITVAALDDEEPALRCVASALRENLSPCCADVTIRAFLSHAELYRALGDTSFDAFFLDIDMPGQNGIDLACDLQKRNKDTPVIFISAKEEYVFESFRVHPFAFVRKHRLASDLALAVRDLVRLLSSRTLSLTLPLRDALGHSYGIDTGKVLYLEALDKYVQVVTETDKTLLRSTLKDMEEQLKGRGFYRCHKSYLVNMEKISAVRHDAITLVTGEALPLRRGQAMELKKALISVLP